MTNTDEGAVSVKRVLLTALVLALSACASADGPSDTRDIMPQDASRPTAYDKRPAKAAWIKWAVVVTVTCRVEANGRPSGCTVRDTAGHPAFGEPALEYARSLVFLPAFSIGTGPVEPSHTIYIVFSAQNRDSGWDVRASQAVSVFLDYPAEVKDGSTGKVQMSCTVRIDGDLGDCKIVNVEGSQAFAGAALRSVRKTHYSPAWQHGKPVPEYRHHLLLVFVPPPQPFNVPLGTPPGVMLSKPQFGTRPAFPYVALGHRGNALVFCDLGEDGVNRNCAVGGVHGDPAFGPAALAHVSSEIVHATRNGVPVAINHRPYIVNFATEESQW